MGVVGVSCLEYEVAAFGWVVVCDCGWFSHAVDADWVACEDLVAELFVAFGGVWVAVGASLFVGFACAWFAAGLAFGDYGGAAGA